MGKGYRIVLCGLMGSMMSRGIERLRLRRWFVEMAMLLGGGKNRNC